MKIKHYSFPKIRQYHQVLRDLKLHSQYVGKDENGDPIFDSSKELPVLKFIGRVKNHGTNAAIIFDLHGDEFYCQSRENIINEEKDNAGFAHWVNKEGYKLRRKIRFNPVYDKIAVYGEWCGGSIQKGVALNELPKMFVVFGAKYIKDSDLEETETEWIDSSDIFDESINVYHINKAGKWEIDIDLSRPDKAVEQMEKWVLEVEVECPFGKMFGVSGTGEGLVMKPAGSYGFDRAYKIKGSEHSKSHVKKLPTVDVEKMNGIEAAIKKFCDEERMQQAWDKIVISDIDKDPKNIGIYIRNLLDDIWEEEADTLRSSDISRKEMGSAVSKKGSRWFQEKLKAL